MTTTSCYITPILYRYSIDGLQYNPITDCFSIVPNKHRNYSIHLSTIDKKHQYIQSLKFIKKSYTDSRFSTEKVTKDMGNVFRTSCTVPYVTEVPTAKYIF